MRMDHHADPYRSGDHRTGFERFVSAAFGYLHSRSSEHWLMFLAGLVIGLAVG
jgi:hypothetical protein